MVGFRVTYEIVTPESAEFGDCSDRGFINEEGIDLSLDEFDLADGLTVIDKAVDYLKGAGVMECSEYPVFTRDSGWFIGSPDENYSTGEIETHSYHPYGYTIDELNAIRKALNL